jgi:hypothetical protein
VKPRQPGNAGKTGVFKVLIPADAQADALRLWFLKDERGVNVNILSRINFRPRSFQNEGFLFY